MPKVEKCRHCGNEVDTDKQKYVVIREAKGNLPRSIAHADCKPGAPPTIQRG
jgi:hypothetical protein